MPAKETINRITVINNLIERRKIQCNLHQNSNDILPRNRKNNPKIHINKQKFLNSQSNPEKKIWS
jgi:hypothetical protein